MHFRNVLWVAGETTPEVQALWAEKVGPSFGYPDGQRRIVDLYKRLVPTMVEGRARYKIVPADDERVLRVLNKIVRGLVATEYDLKPLSSTDVIVCALPNRIPHVIWESMTAGHRDPTILEYRHLRLELELHSAWFLVFYGRTGFMALVKRPEQEWPSDLGKA